MRLTSHCAKCMRRNALRVQVGEKEEGQERKIEGLALRALKTCPWQVTEVWGHAKDVAKKLPAFEYQ